MILDYVIVFLVGGTICLIGQILVIRTQMTNARILVTFLMLGLFLEAVGLYGPLAEFAKCGATVPISGFGATLARGAIEGANAGGLLGAIKGGLAGTSAGIAASVVFSYLIALIFSSKTKSNGK